MIRRLWDSGDVYTVRWTARRMWDDLPGPWWVKVALIAACLAVPGQFDEIALLALTRACRKWRAARVTA